MRVSVSIQSVTLFKNSIEKQNHRVQNAVYVAMINLNELQEQFKTDTKKADRVLENLEMALQKVQSKIAEQEYIVTELEERLDNLINNEPSPAEELISEPDQYDDDGNVVSAGTSYYVETSAHSSWRREVYTLETELSVKKNKLQYYKNIEFRVIDCQRCVQEQISLLMNLQHKLNAGQNQIVLMSTELDELCKETSEKLLKIQDIVQTYLSKNIERYRNASYAEKNTIKIADRNTVSKKNTTYIASNGYKYRTDAFGRTILAEGELQNGSETKRNNKAQKNTTGKIEGDDAGHLIGHYGGGLDAIVNLVAQDSNLNRGEYRQMEKKAIEAIQNGQRVYQSVQVEYEGDSLRPVMFHVTQTIMDRDGNVVGSHNYSFHNSNYETRENRYSIAEERNRAETALYQNAQNYIPDQNRRNDAMGVFENMIFDN